MGLINCRQREVDRLSNPSPIAFLLLLVIIGFIIQCGENPYPCKPNGAFYEQCMKGQEKKEKEQNNMIEISKEKAVAMINETNGKFFGVEFNKKNSTEVRVMNARTGVSKYVTGEGLKFDPVSRGLIPVYDVINKGYRMINISGLTKLNTKGETYLVLK